MNFKGQYGVIYLVYMIRKFEGFCKVPPWMNLQNWRYLSNQQADFNSVKTIGKEILCPFHKPIFQDSTRKKLHPAFKMIRKWPPESTMWVVGMVPILRTEPLGVLTRSQLSKLKSGVIWMIKTYDKVRIDFIWQVMLCTLRAILSLIRLAETKKWRQIWKIQFPSFPAIPDLLYFDEF